MEINFREIVKEKSDEDLLQMVYQVDQWDTEMLIAAENELSARNILPPDIQLRKEQMIIAEDKRLSKGKEASASGQILGWIGIFGILGLIIGYNYCYSKTKSLYTGKEYYTYNDVARENGNYIFIISITTHVLFIMYKFIKM